MTRLKKLWPLAWAKTVRFLEDQLSLAQKQGRSIDRMYSAVKRELTYLEGELALQSKAALEREVALDEELRAAYKESAARRKRVEELEEEASRLRADNEMLRKENQEVCQKAFGHLTWKGPSLSMERVDFDDTYRVILRLPECRVMCGFSALELAQMKGASLRFSEILADKLHAQLLEDLPKMLARG